MRMMLTASLPNEPFNSLTVALHHASSFDTSGQMET
jgi:hypothetical protein